MARRTWCPGTAYLRHQDGVKLRGTHQTLLDMGTFFISASDREAGLKRHSENGTLCWAPYLHYVMLISNRLAVTITQQCIRFRFHFTMLFPLC